MLLQGFATRALTKLSICGIAFALMLSGMTTSASADVPDDIDYEWASFLSSLPVEDQVIWDSPEYFQAWLVTDPAANVALGYPDWSTLTLEEIADLYYEEDETDDPLLTMEELEDIYYEVDETDDPLLTMEELEDIYYEEDETDDPLLTMEELEDIYYEEDETE